MLVSSPRLVSALAREASAQSLKRSPAVAGNIIIPETPDDNTDADGGAAAATNHGSVQKRGMELLNLSRLQTNEGIEQ